MKPTDCIFFQLAKASQNSVRFWGQRAAGLGLTAAQAMVMRFLFDEDGITSKELGERTQLDSATLTGIIDRLEAQKLVVRAGNPDDRRAISVRLTEAGHGVAEKISRLSEEANRDFLKGFSDQEIEMLHKLLAAVRRIA
ncbi:MAG: MarR family transcriptional regulator [Deltaproteobacteria bacterium]|nr:MarR family transcriptional regulator [Candidatus Zymogenaceae bacterium]